MRIMADGNDAPLDYDAEDACSRLADVIFPHIMDRDRRDRVHRELRRFMHEAKRGALQ